VYNSNNGIEQSFRNIPGIEVVSVDRLNLLKLAPGGHLGRFIIWSQAAFAKLDSIFGSHTSKSDVKKYFTLPRSTMFNPDLARIINSDEVQSKVRVAKPGFSKPSQKRNPLVNLGAMLKLNPYFAQVRRAEEAAAKAVKAGKKRKLVSKPTAKERKANSVQKKACLAKFSETLKATPETPASSFLDSYNKVVDTPFTLPKDA